jgi:hypothetical protein
MNRTNRSIAASLLGLATIIGGGMDRPARASGLTGTWSGASANVTLFSQSQSQQGATANASSSQDLNIKYAGSLATNPQIYYNASVYAGVTASAGVDPAHLLQVTASANSPNPGTLGGPTPNNASATASWTNDAAVVTAPAGSNMPAAIRLNFTLTFSVPQVVPYASLTATYNGTTLNYATNSFGAPYSQNIGVDSSSIVPGSGGSPSTLKETFHTDLALNKSGLSAPLDLSLTLMPSVGLVSNLGYSYSGLTGNLALTSVTLPDGTSLSSLGDSVSFESGLASPNVVPEPCSLIVWGLIAIAASAMAVRRSRAVRLDP